MTIGTVYLQVVQKEFKKAKRDGDKTIQQLTQEELHWKANEASNSIAIIIQHMHGNMISRWTDFLTADGEKESRQRDLEFEDANLSKDELSAKWNEGWHTVFAAVDKIEEEHLLQTVYIRGEAHTVLEAVERQIAHYAAHVGQMMMLGKQLKGDAWINLSIPKKIG